MRALLLTALVACGLHVGTAAEVVKTVHPQRDVVIADVVLKPQGAAGDAARLQAAIDAVFRQGGGTVFLTKGTYTIDGETKLGQKLGDGQEHWEFYMDEDSLDTTINTLYPLTYIGAAEEEPEE